MHICLPNQNAKTFDRANKEGVQGGGRKGERGAGEGRKGERREKRRREKGEQEGGRKGEGEGRKGPPCTPLNKHIIRNGPT